VRVLRPGGFHPVGQQPGQQRAPTRRGPRRLAGRPPGHPEVTGCQTRMYMTCSERKSARSPAA
jgi:hypothetical protein